MDSKLFARIGAVAFVAIALTMTALQLREAPAPPIDDVVTIFEPDGDPLPAQLKACNAMGELALSSPDCLAAWAEKRRRFLGSTQDDAAAQPFYRTGALTWVAPALSIAFSIFSRAISIAASASWAAKSRSLRRH